MAKLKSFLFSQKCMPIINALFFLSVLFTRGGLMQSVFLFAAYLVWLVYLAFCIKYADSKGGKIIFSVAMGIVVLLIVLNLYFMIHASNLIPLS